MTILAAFQGHMNKFFGLPESASAHGFEIDQMLEFCHWFMAALFVGWSLFFLLCVWRFRRSKNPVANHYGVRNKLSTHLEVGVVLIEAVLLIGFAFPLWAKRTNAFPDLSEAVQVRAYGFQFGWHIHFPGNDGIFGKRAIEFISAQNSIGLDPSDPAGRDDSVTLNRVPLAANVPAVITVSSFDVIHNFAIHQMRIAQDAIPGMAIPMWFTPVQEGVFEVICGQLCGSGHSNMRAEIEVMQKADFDAAIAGLPKPTASL
jgi:cytochrome c oxidase subunit 2